MPKIAIIGAGGITFPLRLAADLLALPELHGSELVLMDLSLKRAVRTLRAVQELCAHHGVALEAWATDDRREALKGARYVILTFQVGGIEAYRADLEIPRKYGVDLPAGDTLGPGGVFRFLRSAPALRDVAEDVRALCSEAWVLNYTNPMAMNCLYLASFGVRVVGLCHSIPGTARMLAEKLGVPFEELDYLAAGINHQAWFLRLEHRGADLRPRLLERLRAEFLPEYGGSTPWTEGTSTYVGGQERVRAELMDAFGYFVSESSHHSSEYVPYFRKNPGLVSEYIPRRWDYLRFCIANAGKEEEQTRALVEALKRDLTPSAEYGMQVLRALQGGRPARVYGNVVNRGYVENLPAGACVEVPCTVDAGGVHPQPVGKLPLQCAALNQTNLLPQQLAVAAVLEQNPEHVTHALLLDPLTAALLTPPQVQAMTAELLQAQQRWLPEFLRPGNVRA